MGAGDVELMVTVQDETVILLTGGGGKVTGRLNAGSLQMDTIRILQEFAANGKITARRELEILGRLLYATLFDEVTGPFFASTFASARAAKKTLRVLLDFSGEAARLARLPWEYLYHFTTSGESFFLSTRRDLVLARFIALAADRPNLVPDEQVLRLLVVVSQPKGLPPVISSVVLDSVAQLAESLPVQVECLETPTIYNLIDRLEGFRPHVVHLMAHGEYNQNERQGKLALLDSDEASPRLMSDSELAGLFTNTASLPRLAVLHMCEGGAVDLEAGFAGLAPRLIVEGVPAVVAMQYPVTNRIASVFSRGFYRELLKGSPVDRAVQMARWGVTLEDPAAYDRRDFGSAVLYMHSRDGVIFPDRPHPAASLP